MKVINEQEYKSLVSLIKDKENFLENFKKI